MPAHPGPACVFFNIRNFLKGSKMGKDKLGALELRSNGLTFDESLDQLLAEFRMAAYSADDMQAIDWTKLKELLKNFGAVFGPILIQLLLSYLQPKPATP